MSTPSVVVALPAHKHGRNGHTPTPLTAPGIAWLAEAVDRLHAMRAELRTLTEREREVTRAVLAHMIEHGLPAFRAAQALATVTPRTELVPDAELFVTAVGLPAAAPALRVLVDKARLLLGEADLTAISEATTSPMLRVDRLRMSG